MCIKCAYSGPGCAVCWLWGPAGVWWRQVPVRDLWWVTEDLASGYVRPDSYDRPRRGRLVGRIVIAVSRVRWMNWRSGVKCSVPGDSPGYIVSLHIEYIWKTFLDRTLISLSNMSIDLVRCWILCRVNDVMDLLSAINFTCARMSHKSTSWYRVVTVAKIVWTPSQLVASAQHPAKCITLSADCIFHFINVVKEFTRSVSLRDLYLAH